jgi:hypothetical protein
VQIETPTEIRNPIFDGYLKPEGEEYRAEGTKAQIGRPEWWFVSDLVGPSWRAPQGDDIYLLIRLSFSLTPPRNHEIEEARLTANLMSNGPGIGPVAYDLFPRELMEESKTDVKLTLSPSVKLEEIEASLGSAETNIHIAKVEPVVTTSGIGAANPIWAFRRHRRHPILGSRTVYAVIAYPAVAPSISVEVGLSATLRGQFGLWLMGIPAEANAQLRSTIP